MCNGILGNAVSKLCGNTVPRFVAQTNWRKHKKCKNKIYCLNFLKGAEVMSNTTPNATIKSIDDLLQMELEIPNYQRPYKWTRKNVSELLNDIDTAIADNELYGGDFQYRVGTVILHREVNKEGHDIYNIVDGQQRIITLSLIKFALNSDIQIPILSQTFSSKETISHIQDNYALIKDRLCAKDAEWRKRVIDAFANTLESVVLVVEELSEAFQLFDSQNTRGKELYPHDLLKAYHLREMDNFSFEKLRLIKEWEKINPQQIKNLFSTYLYPILKWAQKDNYKPFTASEIESYKGVPADCKYTYGQRVCKAMPYFQINESFCAGGDFFKMTSHYINMLEDIQNEVKNEFKQIQDILNENSKPTKDNQERYLSTGFRYAVNLFYCALLFYYDRFHSFNKLAVKKLFLWAMMLRIDMQNLGLSTINKYALGDGNNSYTNHIPMFYKIAFARKDTDIADLDISVKCENNKELKTWEPLYKSLKNLAGVE